VVLEIDDNNELTYSTLHLKIRHPCVIWVEYWAWPVSGADPRRIYHHHLVYFSCLLSGRNFESTADILTSNSTSQNRIDHRDLVTQYYSDESVVKQLKFNHFKVSRLIIVNNAGGVPIFVSSDFTICCYLL